MNILQVQDDLKNFSQQQLIQEMKQPKGIAPQFLVLGEITRRKRMSDDMKTRGAADQKTVAQEVVSAAGVPQGGLAQMSQAMAPKSSIEPNMQPPSQAQPQAPMTMASGGILSLAAGGGKTKREKAFFLEFPKNSPIFAGERRYVTANTLSKLEASMPLFFKRMRSRGEIIANENAPEAFQKTATKLAPAQLNVAMRRGKENIAKAEEAARIAELQAETGATDDQAVTSAGRPTESQVIDEVQSLDAPVAEPSEYDIQQDSDIEGDLLMADDYDRAEKERLRQEALATGLVPSQTTSQIRDVNSGVKPFTGSAFPSLADMKPYTTTNTPVFNATSDEAAVASAEDIKKQEALRKAQENARAYAEGRTPKQEEEREFDRQKARDSAITALGQIDRSNEPVGFRQIMENKALQQAAIAQANPNMFGDLGAPNTMQEELARKAAEDEAVKEAQAEAQLQSYLRNMEAPTDMIGGIQESDLVREMRKSNEMANQAKIDEILSGGRQGMAFNANLASPELDENVTRAIESRQRREAAERVALKDATEMSIDTASPIGNYGQVAADALRADVGVRDAGLGGAFAKGDEGIKRKLRGFGPFEDSTSEIIQSQLEDNAINDEVARAEAEENDRLDNRRIMQDAASGAEETRAVFGDQSYDDISNEFDQQQFEDYASSYDQARLSMEPTKRAREIFFNQQKQKEINDALGEQELFDDAPRTDEVKLALKEQELFGDGPSGIGLKEATMPYYEKPTMRETGEYGPMIGGIRGRAGTIKQGRAEEKALIDDPRMFGDDGEPKNYFFDNIPGSSYFSDAFNERIAKAQEIQKGTLGKRLGPTLQASEDMRKAASRPLYNYLGMNLDDAPSRPYTFGDTEINPDLTQGGVLSTNPLKVVADNALPVAEVIGDVAAAGAGYGSNYFSGPSSADGSAGEDDTGQAGEAAINAPVVEDNVNPEQEFNAGETGTSESSIITEMDEQAALDAQSSAAYEAERQRKIAAQSKGTSKGTGGTGGSASSQILDLLKSQEANADSDKWLALANAGMALMSSKQPTLGGALGEAGQVGIAGLMKSRQAADAAKLKTLKFQAGLEAAAAKAGLPKDRYKSDVSLFNNTSDNIRGLLTQKGASSPADFLNAAEGTGPDEISEDDKAQLVYLIKIQRDAARRLGYNNPPPVKKIS